MSDHIPDTGKMVPGKIAVLREIAAMLDHPSVYMGGPSQRNMRRAEQIFAVVAPLIAAAERERCARVADAASLSHQQDAAEIGGWSVGGASICVARGNAAYDIAAAIRALGDADE